MNKLHKTTIAVALPLALLAASCNSNDGYQTDPTDFSAAEVTAFALKADKSVLNNLDSVFFSIDQVNARIFNADSLPLGTDVSSVAVNITVDQVQLANLFYTDNDGVEKMVDYLTAPDEKLNFANGPVRLNLISYDGTFARTYTLSVNVHKTKSDSLYWDRMAMCSLPTTLSAPTEQKTVMSGPKIFTLATDGSRYSLATTDNPYPGQWQITNPVAMPKPVDVRSFTGADNILGILATDGSLLVSTDEGATFSPTGEVWHSITAGYADHLLGLVKRGNSFYHVTWPADAELRADASFPITGNSSAASFSSKWAVDPQIVIAGGRCADGSYTRASWAYDGSTWAKISDGLPAGEGFALTSCPVSVTDTVTWRTRERQVMLLFGGRTDSGINNKVYISNDMGITWLVAGEYLQLPDYITPTYAADVLTVPTTMTCADATASSPWHPAMSTRPFWLETPVSRAITPVDQWECPYLYLFGGIDDSGALQNTVWRGVVNHFTFRPLF